ncbi:hypothetical protein MMAG44476_07236 [Mycolicibacterium mageritense DSM 44476 = CIP 104973]|uniref:PE domain-containing protein n=1 Tax=Mycolicibacterium mageritense TaxID=53462 RepID=A0AAI8TTJ7_MYCME|nr:hypothetical protein [Mycolicibacterium mageritense]MBN3459639.1 hypothetical protein [Mycobacterium sp. DSM 3803]OKH73169.1 hypothetical protein EB73_07750 [Mycobacterium sp. SWH-M3]MCC9184042.1 hypothetical protein [Mycolicibacterium mageritense]TXI52514.1 MAG: hypothetical protein E6Q55_36850 [Mycolicibacterium mageritense]CDO21533.1 hypothetical protein BN978_01997 [Mycolicibacterium mageritense DSM 44476 = CIP 104973]
MSDTMKVVPGVLEAFNAANSAAGATISAAGSADAAAMSSAVATAIGPIGLIYLNGFLPAMFTNLTQTVDVGLNHTLIGAATEVTKVSTVATDASFT